MNKQQMIDMIRQQNVSASPELLMSFDDATLAAYLKRLNELHNHRGRETRWVRLGDTTAIVTRTHAPAPTPLAA